MTKKKVTKYIVNNAILKLNIKISESPVGSRIFTSLYSADWVWGPSLPHGY
jgi:hypothetical protein